MADPTLTPVFIEESLERWSLFTLTDGTKLRMKLVPNNILRVDGQYDDSGNPVYQLNFSAAIMNEFIPEELKATKQ
jgi:hypothetical protein